MVSNKHIALAELSTGQLAHNTSKPSLLEGLFDTVLSLGLCLTIHLSYEIYTVKPHLVKMAVAFITIRESFVSLPCTAAEL